MAEYGCSSCVPATLPDLVALAKAVGGIRWWIPADPDGAQADAVHSAIRAGRCYRHAALIGDLVAMTIRDERVRRTLPTIPPPPGRGR